MTLFIVTSDKNLNVIAKFKTASKYKYSQILCEM